MTRERFADTAYWIALLNPDDDLHPSAVRLSEQLGKARLVTTDAVLGEVLTFFSASGQSSRLAAVRLVRDCLTDPCVDVLPVGRE